MKYTSTVRASTLKPVHCEGCGAYYLYKMERQGQGTGSSVLFLDNEGARQRASDEATANARELLREGFDCVPCPKCGSYQHYMLDRLKSEHHRWLGVLGVALVILGLLAPLFSRSITAHQALWVWPAGLAMVLGRRWLASRFEPNEQAHERVGRPVPNSALVTREQYRQAVEAQRRAA
jgi:hypothetical protein